MSLVSLKTGIQEINYSKSIHLIILITAIVVGGVLTISNVIGIGSFLVTLFSFCLLPLLFIAGLEKLFVLLILSGFFRFAFVFGGIEDWEIRDFLTPILFFFFVGRCAIKSEPLNREPRFSIPLLLFVGISLAHILTLEELPVIVHKLLAFTIPAGSLRIFYDLFIYGIIYFLTPFLFKKESQIELFTKLLAGVCIFLIVFSFIRICLGIDYIYPKEGYYTRIHHIATGEGVVPRVGILGVTGYHLFVIGLIFVKPRSNIFFVLLAGVSLTGIVWSGGRAVLLGTVFAIGLYLYLTGKKFRSVILTIVPLLVLMFVGLMNSKITNKLPPIFYRHLTIFSAQNKSLKRHESTRLDMWITTKEIISESPFWGARPVDYKRKYDIGALDNVIRGRAHNAYLSTAASLGLPALAFWLVAAFLYSRKIVYLHKKTHAFSLLNKFCLWLAIALGVSFLTFFMRGGAGGGFLYFLYLGLIDSASNMYNQKIAVAE